MVEVATRAPAWPWIVDAGRCAGKGNSGRATGPFLACRSGAARHAQAVVGVVALAIFYRLLNCGRLRAFLRPAFLRSFTRASRVRKPRRLSSERRLGSASMRA